MNDKRKRTWQTRIAAMTTIGGLAAWGLYLGHNGVVTGLALAAMAGIAGYDLGLEKAITHD